MDNSKIACDKITETYDKEINIIPTNFNEEKAICKSQNLYILLAFLLITIVLLKAVSTYCCLRKYRSKQTHLLREVLY